MARVAERLRENVDGEFFVDSSCIDCGMCRDVAPGVYARADAIGLSIVHRQPRTEDERVRAAMGLVACPTSSIGTLHKIDISIARRRFPEPIAPDVNDVFACGWASRSSFGASSWLVRREGGNVLVDSPRASRSLLEQIRSPGGARFMFLTHRDDVADHAYWHEALGCERVMHADDVTAATRNVEHKLEGRDAVSLSLSTSLRFRFPVTRAVARRCSFATSTSSPATISGATRARSAPGVTFAGFRGPSSFGRSSGCATTVSAGCCPVTAAGTARRRRKPCAPNSIVC